jgi:DNA repair protein RadC
LTELVAADRQILVRQGIDDRIVEALRSFRETHEFVLTERMQGRNLGMSRPVIERYLRGMISCGRVEQFHVVYVDAENRFIEGHTHWTGTVHSVVCYIREIIFTAVACGASGLILAHNHPSGALIPSHEDIDLTGRIIEATRLLDLCVLDHFIVSRQGAASMRDMDLMPAYRA